MASAPAPKPRARLASQQWELPPVPVMYFGFILLVLAVDGDTFLKHLPTDGAWERSSAFAPSREQWALVLGSVLVLAPLFFAWRSLLKSRVFAPMAERWAGLARGTPKHDKFVEQAWLAFHFGFITTFECWALHDKPWWPPVVSESAVAAMGVTFDERFRDQQDPALAGTYATQLAFYALELATLLRTPRKQLRSDAAMYFCA